jgi:hypothetical protein
MSDRLAVQVVATRAALRELLRLLHRSGAIDLAQYADRLESLGIECSRIGAEEGPEASPAAVSEDLTNLAQAVRTDAVLIAREEI